MGRSCSGVLDPVDTLTYASDDWALFWIDIGSLFRIFFYRRLLEEERLLRRFHIYCLSSQSC